MTEQLCVCGHTEALHNGKPWWPGKCGFYREYERAGARFWERCDCGAFRVGGAA